MIVIKIFSIKQVDIRLQNLVSKGIKRSQNLSCLALETLIELFKIVTENPVPNRTLQTSVSLANTPKLS